MELASDEGRTQPEDHGETSAYRPGLRRRADPARRWAEDALAEQRFLVDLLVVLRSVLDPGETSGQRLFFLEVQRALDLDPLGLG